MVSKNRIDLPHIKKIIFGGYYSTHYVGLQSYRMVYLSKVVKKSSDNLMHQDDEPLIVIAIMIEFLQ